MKLIKEITPAPMNTMLVKERRDQVIKKREERKKWSLKMCLQLQVRLSPKKYFQHKVWYMWCIKYSNFIVSCDEPAPVQGHQGQISRPHCKECQQPMKGHKFVLDCPRNKRTEGT